MKQYKNVSEIDSKIESIPKNIKKDINDKSEENQNTSAYNFSQKTNSTIPHYPINQVGRVDILESFFEKVRNKNNSEFKFKIIIILLWIALVALFIHTLMVNINMYEHFYENMVQSMNCFIKDLIKLYICGFFMGIIGIFQILTFNLMNRKPISIKLFNLIHLLFLGYVFTTALTFMENCGIFIKMNSYVMIIVISLKMISFHSTNFIFYYQKIKKYQPQLDKYNLNEKRIKESRAKEDNEAKVNSSQTNKEKEPLIASIKENINIYVPKEVPFPKNINIKDYLFFIWFAPTLIYRTNFPRTKTIRIGFIFFKLFQIIFLYIILGLVFSAYLAPSLKYYDNNSLIELLEWSLLNTPSNVIIVFIQVYNVFYCFPNMISELTYYGDRCFYRDWWNATSIEEFWRKWNNLFHEWVFRHINIDLKFFFLLNKYLATILVFLFSALIHEGLTTYVAKKLQLYFFIVMLLQVPIIIFEKLILKGRFKRIGNLFVWITLIIALPLFILLSISNWINTSYKTPCSLFCINC